MKAAVLRAPKVLEVGDIATPEAQPGELILAIRASTVCGTDLRILTGKKTVLAYLLKPVLRAKANALTER